MSGNKLGARVSEDGVDRSVERRLKYNSSEFGVGCCDFQSKVGAEIATVEHNRAGIDVARCYKVLQRPLGVLTPAGFTGVYELAFTVAAIVEGKRRSEEHTSELQSL